MELQEKELIRKVENYINRDDRIRNGRVKVDAKGNTIKLEGKVSNYMALRAAENDAYFVAGVKAVDNYLQVEPPGTIPEVDDLEIESNIRNILLWDNRIDSTETSIMVDQGHVELDGSVYSFWEKQLAEEIALSVNGVLNVQNNLVVNTKHDMNDDLIADRVYEALDSNPYVNSGDITIAVNNGLVTLTGAVQTYQAATEAHDALLYITGVRGIANNITIG